MKKETLEKISENGESGKDHNHTISHSRFSHNSIGLYTVGILNFLHGASHAVQVFQSTYMASKSFESSHEHMTWLDAATHNPYMGVLWAAIGVGAIYLGYRDHKEHKKHEAHIHELEEENRLLKDNYDSS